jgi:ribonuclease P protein component
LIVRPSELDHPHIGVTTSHHLGGAVERNRAKRLLREASRSFLPRLQPADIVLIARPPLAKANLDETRQALKQLLKRADLLHDPNESIT